MIEPALQPATVVRPITRRSALSPLLVVFCAGINLILVQWILVRELTALLLGTELVTLLVSVAYFAGLSVGYKLSARIRRAWLPPLAVITLALHLTLPVWFRLLVTALDSSGAYWAAFIVLPLATVLLVPAFYSVFLPLTVENDSTALPRVYGLELLGSACGVVGLIVLGGVSVQAVYILYTMGAMGILLTLRAGWHWIIFAGLISAIWIVVFPAANIWSNTLWYVQMAGLPDGTTTLFTGYSPYQKVDVLETPTGARYLFLDGLEHFGDSDGTRLNVAMGQIPASLVKPTNALVVGAGSMQMAALIADYAGLVTTVEIDPMVVDASERYFDAFNRMSTLTNRRVVIDDAKHYVANSSERYDLVAMDIPAAYSLQTATLYSAPFYAAIAQHLNADGILVANLTSIFSPNSLTSRRITASLLANFKDVMVYTPDSAGWSFALASNHLTIDRNALAAALQASGEAQFVIYETPAVRAIVGDAPPITLDSMDIVLQTSARWIADRWRGGKLMRLRAIYPTLVGLLLGTLQTGLYFQLSFTLSSGFGTYLMVTLCWLVGSMIGVLWVARQRISTLAVLLLASCAYVLCCLLLLLLPFNTTLVPVYAVLIMLVGVYPGVFFARTSALYRVSVLFFRENNGFILGLALGTLLFMLLGRPALWFPPLLLIACLVVSGRLPDHPLPSVSAP